MSAPTDHDYRTLEQLRQRLNQLTIQLDRLLRELSDTNQPLPSWPSLHAHSSILAQNITTLFTHLENNPAFFNSAVVFPRPNFPPEQQPLLEGLLGKKAPTEVQDWINEGGELGVEGGEMEGDKWKNLWEWAAMAGNEEARKHEWGADDSDEDEEESDEDEEKSDGPMDVDGDGKTAGAEETVGDITAPSLSSDQWLRYLTKGELPVR